MPCGGAASLAAELERQDISVHGALAVLTDRVAAISAENTDEMENRLKAVEEQAAKTKSALASQPGAEKSTEIQDYAEKVNEMYEIGKKWDSVATAVPDVVCFTLLVSLLPRLPLHSHASFSRCSRSGGVCVCVCVGGVLSKNC